MSEDVRIIVLVENSVHRHSLFAEHGLAFHIQIGPHSLLFDTGQTDLALVNAETLHIPLDRIEAIALSHGHYDHTGGLAAVLDAAPSARVYLHPAAFENKYSKSPDGKTRFIGMNPTTVTTVQALRHGRNFIKTTGCTRILDGVFVTGEIPRMTAYEDTGGPFFLDADCTRPDPLTDDQALMIDLGQSVLVLLGCAHAGVVNTLNHVRQLTGGKLIRAVIGGLHLGSATEGRVQQTISRLREANLDCLAPVHCTGWPATARLWQGLPEIYRSVGVGTTLAFERD